MKKKKYSYNFVLYKEHLVYGAISHDIVRRAMGVSIYRPCRITLIGCEKKFVDHLLEYVADSPIEIIQTTPDIGGSNIKCKDGEIIITHTWMDTLFMTVNIYNNCILVLIENTLPLSDRFPKLDKKQKLTDKFLTWNPILKGITRKYRKAIRRANIYVAISDIQAELIKKYYSLMPDLTSYAPVDNRIFYYTENERNAIMIFGNAAPHCGIINEIINSGLFQINEIICVNPQDIEPNIIFPGLKITTIKHYTFEEIRQCYARTIISITSENRGSFELIPIESIMSGVPIISPQVPSLAILKQKICHYDKTEISNLLPFFDHHVASEIAVNSYEKGQFYKWLRSVDLTRESFATKTTDIFSIPKIAYEFINKVEKALDSKVTHNIPEFG